MILRSSRINYTQGPRVGSTDRGLSGMIAAHLKVREKSVETPLTPLEFMRRTRSLYPDREAVIDGATRFTYEQFFERCDRWSATLQRLGVTKGDRVAYISPNTHQNLESFYGTPQIGAVLVPINFRLTPAEIEYILTHSGAKVVCAHSDYLEAIETIRHACPAAEHCIALEGEHPGWQSYEALLDAESASFERPDITERDLLTINYTSGTTSRPKGVMITHRNAYMNMVGTLLHHLMTCADRHLWTLPMFHANGWTFVWIVTAVGGTHVCLRQMDPTKAFKLVRDESITIAVRGTDRVDRARQRAGRSTWRRASGCAGDDGGGAAGGSHDSACRGRLRLGAHSVLRADRDRAVCHGVRAQARA